MLHEYSFITNYWYFSAGFFILNLVMVYPIAVKILFYLNRMSIEGMGDRRIKKSTVLGIRDRFKSFLIEYDKRDNRLAYYDKLKLKVRKSGYRSIYAPVVYLFAKIIVPIIIVIIGFVLNRFQMAMGILGALIVYTTIEIFMNMKKRDLNMRFRKYIYKIYRYLHNQVSSGVMVSDAIKTVYKVVQDKQIQKTLIELSARYALTSNIEDSLEVFYSTFGNEEVETLCLAIKQGIDTGDNKDILLRQENYMFSKYFSYIQAETDRSSFKSLVAALLFILILMVMISVPLIQEGAEGITNIFIN